MQATIIYVGVSLVAVQKMELANGEWRGTVEVTLPMADWHCKTNPPKLGQSVDLVWDMSQNRWKLA